MNNPTREAVIALSPVQSTVQITKELNMAGFAKIERVDFQDALVAHININKPQIIVISSELPGTKKVSELLNEVEQASPESRVILIDKEIDMETIFDIYLSKNVKAWLLSERFERTLPLAIEAAEAGQLFIDFAINQMLRMAVNEKRTALVEGDVDYGRLELLTEREAEILQYLCEGHNYKLVAKKLFISESTVKTHINNVFTKLQVNDRTQAVLYALKHDLEGLMKAAASI